MTSDLFRFQDFELDRNAYELRRSGQSVRLERIPYELLSLLVERRGQLVTREEIIERIWGKDVFHDTEHGINTAIRKIRQALHDDPEVPRFVLTVPGRGYRFVAPVEKVEPAVAAGPPVALGLEKSPLVERPRRRGHSRILIPAVLFLLAIGVTAFFHFHRVQALSEKDTIVIADFANSTGEAVFDDTLKQALSVQLEQSPFLSILSDKRVSETLQMMGHPADERVTQKTALEICQRTQSVAVLAGSIATLGSQYVIGLNAVTCQTGDILVKEQLRANSKEEVLKVVDRAATKLRGKLGESLSMIQKFDIPIEQATTPSLEALQAYSLGQKNLFGGNIVEAVSAFQSAVSIDPNFAIAYAMLGTCYSDLGAGTLATENTRKAYELREHVSEREKLYIESHYHMFVTGNAEKGREVFELWAQIYPRDSVPPYNLGAMYGNLGQFDKALEETRESLRLDQGGALNYATLAYFYLTLNRVTEARATADEAVAKKFDSPSLHITLYLIAFAQNDDAGMAREVAWGTGKHGMEDSLLACASDTAAYSGRLKTARVLSRRAVLSAQQADKTEATADYQAASALREALFGNGAYGRQQATAALTVSKDENPLFIASLALAVAGDTSGAQGIVNELAKRFPEDTIVQFIYLPTLRSRIALGRGTSANAIDTLLTAAPYELGDEGGCGFAIALYPIYVRGEAYLAARRGPEAAVEFQKILDHRGVVLMAPIGALAPLGMGRAYALQGEAAKARAAYQDFFTLWKDADPDIPVLIAAKSEYSKLK
jgi:DNA-binding winged helix-turn-helix (wHTH) protein/tetratricopeptide (TPR) repeat protein